MDRWPAMGLLVVSLFVWTSVRASAADKAMTGPPPRFVAGRFKTGGVAPELSLGQSVEV